MKFEIYDPRIKEDCRVDFGGTREAYSSLAHQHLVVWVDRPSVFDIDYIRGMIESFSGEKIFVLIDMVARRKKDRQRIASLFGLETVPPKKKEIYASFDYSHSNIERVLQAYMECGEYEQWLFGTTDCKRENCLRKLPIGRYDFPFETLLRPPHLFRQMLFCNLDCPETTAFVTDATDFEKVLSYVRRIESGSRQ